MIKDLELFSYLETSQKVKNIVLTALSLSLKIEVNWSFLAKTVGEHLKTSSRKCAAWPAVLKNLMFIQKIERRGGESNI